MVVDDRPTINQVINLALKGHGYEVQAAQTGRDAIVQIAIFKPEIVLVDIRLPDLTAFEIKREIDRLDPHSGIKFVLMMVANESYDESEAHALGFAGRLTKPFDPPYLRQILNEVLGTSVTSIPGSTRELKTPPPPPGSPHDPSATVDRRSDAKKIPPAAPKRSTPPPFQSQNLPKAPAPEVTIGIPSSAITPPPSSDEKPQWNAGDDIKKLTESTIRMSGLDDFDWSISDESKKSHDPLWSDAPSSDTHSRSNSSIPIIELDEPDSQQSIKLDLDFPFDPAQAAFAPTPKTIDSPSPALDLSGSADLEAMIQARVEERVQKIAQQLLPEIAERVIKNEIRRLLGEVAR